MRKLLWILLPFLMGLGMGHATSPAYTLWINGNPSKTALIQEKEEILVPLNLAAPGEWNVAIVKDESSRQVQVTVKAIKRKLRGADDCYYCKATGDCPQDSPAGSGLNYSGVSDYFCNGTGKCYHCSGTGKL